MGFWFLRDQTLFKHVIKRDFERISKVFFIGPKMNKFLRQTYVLLKKNLLLHVRNRTSTIAQCGIGILLILALYVIFFIAHSPLSSIY